MSDLAPCWSCQSTAECFEGCLCAKCVDPIDYDHWRNSNIEAYEAWLDEQRDSDLDARVLKLKTYAARQSRQLVDLLNRRDRFIDDLQRPAPRWWREAEAAGHVQPWAERCADWRRRLVSAVRLIALIEVSLTNIDEQLADLLAEEAAADKREAVEEAALMRGRKNGYAHRLRPNLKPPLKQLGLGW